MDFEAFKVKLYRAQQRLAITRNEATALLALAALLVAGTIARHLQRRPQAIPASTFAATDHRFQQSAARFRAASRSSSADTAGKGNARRLQATPSPSAAAPLALNAATPDVLEALPGVGPVIARRIAAYRTTHGPFAEIGHLERVPGIGPKTMQRLAPLLTLGAPGDSAETSAAAPTPAAP